MMTDVNPRTGEVLDAELTEAEVIKLLIRYVEAREARDTGAAIMDSLARPIREWLNQHLGEHLVDGEHGLRAFLQDRDGTKQLDCMTLAGENPQLALWAMEKGLLKLDAAALKALDGKARETLLLKDFVYPGPGSQSLQVKEER